MYYQTQVAWPSQSSAVQPPISGQPSTLTPLIDVYESPSEFVYIAEVPGCWAESLDVEVVNNQVTVSGVIDGVQERQEIAYRYQERPRGSFFRAMTLLRGITAETVTAELKNGLLEIHFPKSVDANRPMKGRKVPVQREQPSPAGVAGEVQ